MTKRYGGKIENWTQITIPEEYQKSYADAYGPNLGYLIYGRIGKDHKNRGFDNGPIRTSLVVKNDGKQIETLNTIYDLGERAES